MIKRFNIYFKKLSLQTEFVSKSYFGAPHFHPSGSSFPITDYIHPTLSHVICLHFFGNKSICYPEVVPGISPDFASNVIYLSSKIRCILNILISLAVCLKQNDAVCSSVCIFRRFLVFANLFDFCFAYTDTSLEDCF